MDLLKSMLPENIYTQLIEANLDSPKLIFMLDKCELQRKTKLNTKDIEQVLEILAHGLIHNKMKTALEIQPWVRISIGCDNIDSILNGGLPANGINEIVGASSVGKTQIAMQYALNVQLNPSFGGLGKGAVYISTEDVFPIKRLHQLAKICSMKYMSQNIRLEDNIFIEHIAEYEQLRRCLYVRIPNLLKKIPIGVIIIDSIAGAFRSETTSSDYTSRSSQFYSIAAQLKKLSNEYNLVVLSVNQMTDNLTTCTLEPALGLSWSNLVTSRFEVSRLNETQQIRRFKIIFAPDLPLKNCNFLITEEGLTNI